MKILTKENASELLGGKPLDTFLGQLSNQVHLVANTYSIPSDSGRKTALARLLAYLLLRNTSVCVYVSGWGVWGSSENLDLFYGYRRSFGESRLLMEAPVHLFERSGEDAFVSILCMVFYFFWDAWVFDIEGKALVRISHDEWLEVRTDDHSAREEFATELERYGIGGWPTQALPNL
jgi:hypothetical protein